jgi:CPA2 family monovalent cation:H+ antiporter-2
MFGIGLHFSLKDLLSVRAIALPGALVQIVGATGLGLGLGLLLGWPVGAGLIFGLALSVASTIGTWSTASGDGSRSAGSSSRTSRW